jgi:hypothetical protein
MSETSVDYLAQRAELEALRVKQLELEAAVKEGEQAAFDQLVHNILESCTVSGFHPYAVLTEALTHVEKPTKRKGPRQGPAQRWYDPDVPGVTYAKGKFPEPFKARMEALGLAYNEAGRQYYRENHLKPVV